MQLICLVGYNNTTIVFIFHIWHWKEFTQVVVFTIGIFLRFIILKHDHNLVILFSRVLMSWLLCVSYHAHQLHFLVDLPRLLWSIRCRHFWASILWLHYDLALATAASCRRAHRRALGRQLPLLSGQSQMVWKCHLLFISVHRYCYCWSWLCFCFFLLFMFSCLSYSCTVCMHFEFYDVKLAEITCMLWLSAAREWHSLADYCG